MLRAFQPGAHWNLQWVDLASYRGDGYRARGGGHDMDEEGDVLDEGDESDLPLEL